MNIWQKITDKPWLPGEAVAIDIHDHQHGREGPHKTALHFFLAVVTVVFFLFTITYLSRSQSPDFQALAGEPWLPFTTAYPLWLNTAVLLFASLGLHASVYFSKKQQLNTLLFSMAAVYICTAGFLLGQYAVWQQLLSSGYGVADNPANSFFYLLTGIHGLHLFGGILVLIKVTVQFWLHVDTVRLNGSLALCARYWHYLFVVWVFLFCLLTATPETYRAIAVFCGF